MPFHGGYYTHEMKDFHFMSIVCFAHAAAKEVCHKVAGGGATGETENLSFHQYIKNIFEVLYIFFVNDLIISYFYSFTKDEG